MVRKIDELDVSSFKKAQEAVLRDEVICFKSDTVYGFACNALSDKAVENLYKLKKRDQKKPIAIFVNDLTMAGEIFEFDDFLLKICQKYLPGHLTIVTKVKDVPSFEISRNLNLESNLLGFRIVEGEFVNKLISSLSFPLAVTSANLSNSKELLSADLVMQEFDDDFLLIDGGQCKNDFVSTVVRVEDGDVEVLRQGIIQID